MSNDNKQNLLYFESSSVRELYNCMQNWQNENNKRILSISIQKDDNAFCCIALTKPSEVAITSVNGKYHARVDQDGLNVWNSN